MNFTISTKPTKDGFHVLINQKSHTVVYPHHIWNAFPKELHQPFSELIAFISTAHFGFHQKNKLQYMFPNPLAQSLYFYGLFLAMPENNLHFPNRKYKTTDYLRQVFNSFYRISFSGHPRPQILTEKMYQPDMKTVMLPFTFGKDSLLTLAICKELEYKTLPIFILEPCQVYENKHKIKLIKKFKDEFGQDVITFSTPLADLKENRGFVWGWDNFLTQYTFFLFPFIFFYKPAYFLWSNEKNRNSYIYDNEKFILNPTMEQSSAWMQLLNTGLRMYGITAQLGSILEPLTELAVFYILHYMYPQLAKYQSSCVNEMPAAFSKKWCEQCDECARVYIYLLSLGINPRTVGFQSNMLSLTKRGYFQIFSEKQSNNENYIDQFIFHKNEKLYAFYLAYKRGIRTGVMQEFIHRYLKRVRSKKHLFQKQYFQMYESVSIPSALRKRALLLYNKFLSSASKIS